MRVTGDLACNLCGHAQPESYLRCERGRMVRCPRCGLVYSSPRQDPNQAKEFFTESYFTDTASLVKVMEGWRLPELQRIHRIAESAQAGGRILDIGAASGAFLDLFDQQRWARHAVEPSRLACERLAAKGIATQPGFLADGQFPDHSFDVVTCLDALCFAPDPKAELTEVFRIVKPGGTLILELPGWTYRRLRKVGLVSLLASGRWVGFDPSLHAYFFSRQTTVPMLQGVGFQLEGIHAGEGPARGILGRLVSASHRGVAVALERISSAHLCVAAKEIYVAQKPQVPS